MAVFFSLATYLSYFLVLLSCWIHTTTAASCYSQPDPVLRPGFNAVDVEDIRTIVSAQLLCPSNPTYNLTLDTSHGSLYISLADAQGAVKACPKPTIRLLVKYPLTPEPLECSNSIRIELSTTTATTTASPAPPSARPTSTITTTNIKTTSMSPTNTVHMTPSPTVPSTADSTDNIPGPSIGTIIGLVSGAVAGIVVILAVIFLWRKRRQSRASLDKLFGDNVVFNEKSISAKSSPDDDDSNSSTPMQQRQSPLLPSPSRQQQRQQRHQQWHQQGDFYSDFNSRLNQGNSVYFGKEEEEYDGKEDEGYDGKQDENHGKEDEDHIKEEDDDDDKEEEQFQRYPPYKRVQRHPPYRQIQGLPRLAYAQPAPSRTLPYTQSASDYNYPRRPRRMQ